MASGQGITKLFLSLLLFSHLIAASTLEEDLDQIVSGTFTNKQNPSEIIWQDEENISDILGPYIQNYSKYNRKFKFEEDDVMIFLHIQKTSGSNFGRHLVRDLDSIKNRCHKIRDKIKGKKGKRKIHQPERWNCHRNINDENFNTNQTNEFNSTTEGDVWLISRFSTGWKCGTHADFTELIDCIPGVIKDYFGEERNITERWVTSIRNPADRFISEWKHVQRKATWHGQRLRCGNTDYAGKKEKKNNENKNEPEEPVDHFYVPKCWTMDKYKVN